MRLKDRELKIGERTLIMGILNVTPDSFSDGGEHFGAGDAVSHARRMIEEGADIVDIGGESTRPGSKPVTALEEIERVIPVIKAIRDESDVPISVDTYKSEVARAALAAGADIVNDITALNGDEFMAKVIAEADAAVILMHMKGTPETMQADPDYDDVISDIIEYLTASIDKARSAGIAFDKIIIDPGIGFGKTVEHNLTILSNIGRFKELDMPVLIGSSRKSFIGSITGKDVNKRQFGTAASVTAAILNGADIIRVHDVPQMKDTAILSDAIKDV